MNTIFYQFPHYANMQNTKFGSIRDPIVPNLTIYIVIAGTIK